MIHVLAFVTTKPGQRDAVLAIFNANVPAVLGEDGCIEYGATTDTPDGGPMQTLVGPDTFVVVEKWASPAALEAHRVSAHMRAYGARTRDLLANRVIHVLAPQESGGAA